MGNFLVILAGVLACPIAFGCLLFLAWFDLQINPARDPNAGIRTITNNPDMLPVFALFALVFLVLILIQAPKVKRNGDRMSDTRARAKQKGSR